MKKLIQNLKLNSFKNKRSWQKGFVKLSKHLIISYLVAFFALSSIAGLFLFNPFGTKETEAAWFNDNWAYRKTLTFTHNATVSTPTKVKFDIDTTEAPEKFQSDCGDVRFTSPNGDILPYFYDSAGGACDTSSTDFYVLIPSIINGSNYILMYYGNPSVTNGTVSANFSQSTTTPSGGAASAGSEEKGPSPVGYWKFDDGQGTTPQDATVNNSDFTFTGTTNPTWQTEDQCISGKCLYYTGTGSTTGSAVYTATLTPYSQLTTGSISFWAKSTLANAEQTMFAFTRTTDTVATRLAMEYDNRTSGGSNLTVRLTSDNTNQWAFTVSSAQFNAINETNKWHQYTLVQNGTEPVLYIDGVAMTGNFTVSTNKTRWLKYILTDAASDVNVLVIGFMSSNNSIFTSFKGFVDEFKIYPQNLTAVQVMANYNARSNPEGTATVLGTNTQNMPDALSDGLLGYWKLDENTGSSTVDSSGNGKTGTITNSTWTNGKFASGLNYGGSSTNKVAFSSTSLGTQNTTSFWVYQTGAVDGVIVGNDIGIYTAYLDGISSGDSIYYSPNNGNFVSAVHGGVPANTWTHFAVVRNESAVTFYKNGVQIGNTQTLASNTSLSVNCLLNHCGGTNVPWLGVSDEIRIYNRALSSSEVSQLYNWAPGPAAYYRFDEKSGQTTADVSGNGNNGTLGTTSGSSSDDPIWNQGKYGGSLDFDGTDDYVAVGGNSANNILGPITVSAWIKPDAVSGDIVARSSGSSTTVQYELRLGGTNQAQFFMSNSAGTTATGVSANNSISTGVWQHITGTYDGSTLNVYVNGVQTAAGVALNTSGGQGTSNSFMIGRRSAGGSQFYNGSIDEVKVYNYVRTQGQIVEDINASHPAPGSPISSAYGFWKFDEGYGTTANNNGNGGTGITGTLTSMASPATSTSGWIQEGKFGKALAFDGSNDFVSLGDITGTDGVSRATWTFWAKPSTTGTSSCLWCKVTTPSGTPAQSSWGIMTDSSDSTMLRAFIANGTTDVSQYGSTPTGALTNATWSHVAVVYDGTQTANQRLKIYINGLPVTTTITGTIPTSILNTTASANFGRSNTSGQNLYTGSLDETKLYLSALTEDQVQIDMNRAQAQVMGALSTSSTAGNDNASTRTAQSAASAYCIPGDSATCTGPVGDWKFDEGTGTTANDSSGTANTGTLTNSPLWTNGKVNKGINFINGSNQYVTIPAAASINDLGPVTYEAWIYPRTAGQSSIGRIFDKLSRTYVAMSNTRIEFTIDYATTDLQRITTDTVNLNQWSHVAVTWDGTTTATNVHIYINGKEVTAYTTTTSGNGARQSDAAGGQVIGNRSTDSARDFDGVIDQPKIFNYARTSGQIAWDYNKGGPLGLWRMDECQGTVINDASGNSNTGTLTIGATGTYTTPGTCSASSASSAWYNGLTGKRNYSLAFDGTDDLVTIPSNAMMNSGTLTVSAWTYTTAVTSLKNAISRDDGGSNRDWNLGMGSSNSTYRFALWVGNTQNNAQAATGFSTNAWHHLVGTYDGTTMKLYVDGKLTASTSVSGTADTDTTSIKIGARGTQDYWTGQLDDARFYNYALTETQVKDLYNEGAYRSGPVTGAP